MKKNIAIVLAFLAFALVGCEDKTPFEPGPAATTKQFIYAPLPAELGQELDPEAGITSHDFVLERKDTKDAQTVKLVVIENTDNAFDVPASVTFAAGEAQATVTFKFNKMEVGGTYKLTVQVDLASIDPYSLDVNAAGTPNVPVYEYEATLIKYLIGVWVDETVGPAFDAGESAWTVKYLMEENEDGYIQFDIVNPYNGMATAQDEHGIPNGFPLNEPGDFEEGVKHNFTLLMNPESGEVVFDRQETDLGVAWGSYGEMFFYDYAAGEGTYGRYDKDANEIIFDAQDQSMLMGMGEDLYAINVNFEFFLTVDDFLKVDAAAIRERIVNKTVFGAQRIR